MFSVITLLLSLVVSDPIFSHYEQARLALTKDSLAETKKAATQLSAVARTAKLPAISDRAAAVARANDLAAARTEFGKLSDEVIVYRNAKKGDRPVVAYCSMEKKSWLQPKGPIGNPYGGSAMLTCGEVQAEK